MTPPLLYSIYFFLFLVLFGIGLIGRRFFAGRRWPVAGSLVVMACVIGFLAMVSEPRSPFLFSDFRHAYYPAGSWIRSNPYKLYNQYEMKFVNIPILAWLFTPLSLLSETAAQVLFTGMGIAAVLAAWVLLCRLTKASGWKRLLLVGVVALNGPLFYSLREGNLTHFVLLLLVVAALCLERGRGIAAGVMLALAALIKLPLFLLGGCFLLRRQWRVLMGFGGTVLLTAGVSVLVFGLDLHRFWYEQCVRPFMGRPLVAFNVQSTSGFLARLVSDQDPDTSGLGTWESWQPIAVSRLFKAGHFAFVSLLAGATAWACRRPAGRGFAVDSLELSLFLCLALVASPISWTHYYLLLLLPLCLCLGGRLAVPAGPLWSGLLLASVALLSAPVTSFAATNLVVRTLVSHYWFGGMLLWATLLALRLQTAKLPRLLAATPEEADDRPMHDAEEPERAILRFPVLESRTREAA
jgi:hypothetical protein